MANSASDPSGPPEASGFTYALQAWCQPPGSHALRDSGREVVTVQ